MYQKNRIEELIYRKLEKCHQNRLNKLRSILEKHPGEIFGMRNNYNTHHINWGLVGEGLD